jgi:hypothetical protein
LIKRRQANPKYRSRIERFGNPASFDSTQRALLFLDPPAVVRFSIGSGRKNPVGF